METRQKLIGGQGVEFQHFANRIIEGMLMLAPSSASTQATGAGTLAVRVNINAGLQAVGSTVKELAAQADLVLFNAATVLTTGQSVVFDIVAYRSKGDGLVYQRTFRGTAATTGSEVAPSDASIEAALEADTAWMRISRTTVNRTGDTTVTQTYNNTVRNTLVPGTVHYGTNPY